MIRPAERLTSLSAAAALVSGWPRIRVFGHEPATLERAQAQLAHHLGPLPQADRIDPFDPGTGEPWELRVDLPGLAPWRWLVLRDALGGIDHHLEPGESIEATLADDLGARRADWIDGSHLSACLYLDAEGQQQVPELQRRSSLDAPLEALEAELVEALRAADPRLVLRSDRGPDTLQPVLHAATGRLGVELALAPEPWRALDGDAVMALRRAAVDAVGEVVLARHDHPTLRLAPDLRWWGRLDALHLVAWIIAPPAPPLPRDAPIDEEHLAPDVRDALPPWCHDFELQVVTDTPEALLASLPSEALAGLAGGPPRWVHHEGRWRFVPTWRVAREAIADVPAALTEGPHRWVPGRLVGRDDDDAWLERHVVTSPRGLALRVRDPVRDRDLRPLHDARAPTPDDARLLQAVLKAIGPSHGTELRIDSGLPGQPVGHGGHPGLRLTLARADGTTHALLRRLLEATPCAPWVDWWIQPSGRLGVLLWHPGDADAPPPERRWV